MPPLCFGNNFKGNGLFMSPNFQTLQSIITKTKSNNNFRIHIRREWEVTSTTCGNHRVSEEAIRPR